MRMSNEEGQLEFSSILTRAVSMPVDHSVKGSGVTAWSKA